jgi:enamine deaminase RidA (YjgF/YER057c/UK114 family)
MSALDRHVSAPSSPPPADARPAIAAARRYGDLVITSGQTAHVDGVNVANGVVGREVDLESARHAAWQCAHNVVAALVDELGDLGRVVSVPRLTVYVASTADFTDQHLVADAATTYLQLVLGERGVHTRTAIGVASLPTGSPVEVEAIVSLADPTR